MTSIKQEPQSTATTAPAQKIAVVTKRRGQPRNQSVATCQLLDTIEEMGEDPQPLTEFDFCETESEAADLCEILEDNSELDSEEPIIDFTSDQA